ncbi:MAG: hypothetical protein LUG60_00275 [Erysipelotrichaceae bacterium]|nr:hypothetical protein [Erysipelotrichaceae bacterium]
MYKVYERKERMVTAMMMNHNEYGDYSIAAQVLKSIKPDKLVAQFKDIDEAKLYIKEKQNKEYRRKHNISDIFLSWYIVY